MSEQLGKLELQQLSIVVAAKNYNPARISLDFLTVSGIIPSDWQLRKKPYITSELVQLQFNNGVNITAQSERIIFGQEITQFQEREILAPVIAHRYVEKLPAADYQYLQTSLGSIYSLGEKEDTVRHLIVKTLLSHSPWHSFGKSPVKASIDLLYELEHCQLNLKVDEARLQKSETSTIPALMFAGNFNYPLANYNEQEKLSRLCQLIDNWQKDLKTFQEIVEDNILETAISALPNVNSEQELTEKVLLANGAIS
jgi:hypothetical protein